MAIAAGVQSLMFPARGSEAECDPAHVQPGADQPLPHRPGQAAHLGPGVQIQEEPHHTGGETEVSTR